MKKVENLYSRNSRQNSLTILLLGSLLRALRLEVTFFSAKNNRGPGKRERRRSRKDRMEKPERKTFFVVTIFFGKRKESKMWKTRAKAHMRDTTPAKDDLVCILPRIWIQNGWRKEPIKAPESGAEAACVSKSSIVEEKERKQQKRMLK